MRRKDLKAQGWVGMAHSPKLNSSFLWLQQLILGSYFSHSAHLARYREESYWQTHHQSVRNRGKDLFFGIGKHTILLYYIIFKRNVLISSICYLT